MNLFLLPGTYGNLNESVYQSIPATRLEKFIEKTILARIIQKVGSNYVNCWAFSRRSGSNYYSIKEGDVVLFKENGTRIFSVRAQVADKIISRELGNNLWPIVGEEPWALIFFIKNTVRVSIESARIFEDFGYDSNYWLPGAKRVANARLEAAIRKYGSLDNLINGEGKAPSFGNNTRIIRRPGAGARTAFTGQPMRPSQIGMSNNAEDEDPWKI